MSATDFNLTSDPKPVPLMSPQKGLNGHITDVRLVRSKKDPDTYLALVFGITLNNNGGFMTNGSTPIDGSTHDLSLWFPKEGDEDAYTGSGKETKRQWKINRMSEVLNGNFPEEKLTNIASIEALVASRKLIGIGVKAEIGINEYNGKVTNQVDNFEVIA